MEYLGPVPDKKAGMIKKVIVALAWVLFTIAISKQMCSMSDYAWQTPTASAVKQTVAETQAKIMDPQNKVCCGIWGCKQRPEGAESFQVDGGCILPKEGYECVCKEWDILPYTPTLNDSDLVLQNVSYDVTIRGYELVRK